MTHQTLDIHDLVNELTRPRTHHERYTVHRDGTAWLKDHTTLVPSLIEQLQAGIRTTTGEPGAGGYASRPAAQLEALDTLIHLDLAAARWVRDLGEDDPGDTAACIRRLHALHASADHCDQSRPERGGGCCPRHAIEHDVRRWWTQARIATGWDSPAWRPDNTCPACDKRGTLRVRLSAQAGLCIECRETWDDTTIGLLADHIRHENHDQDDDADHEESA